MFNLNELFIPANYDLSKWDDVDNLLYKNKAYFQAYNTILETCFYNQYYDFTEKSKTTQAPMNVNYSIIVDRVVLYLTSLDPTILDVVLDGELKDWKVKVDDYSMKITYRSDFEEYNKSYKEKAYLLNIKESSELSQYKDLKKCIELFKNKDDEIIFLSYEKLVDVIDQRLTNESEDKKEAKATIDAFKDAYKDNQGSYANDEWEDMYCVIEDYEPDMEDILEEELYVIPTTELNVIDYSILNTRLKSICLKEQNKY